jgi:hypothetical protein
VMQCAICAHEKVKAINAALATKKVAQGFIARRYRLEPSLLSLHAEHRTLEQQGSTLAHMPVSIDMLLTPVLDESAMVERPFTRVKHAWQDAKNDGRERQLIVDWLNQQLAADDGEHTTWGGDDVA